MNQIKTELGSYVALYEINMDKNDAEHISIPITDKLTKRWGITADQLYQDTIKVQAAWNQPLLADLLEMGAYLNGGQDLIICYQQTKLMIPGCTC